MTFSVCIILCQCPDHWHSLSCWILCSFAVSLFVLQQWSVWEGTDRRRLNNSISWRQSSWRGGGIISNQGKWPGLERSMGGGGSQGFQARSGLSPLWKHQHRCPARQNTRLHMPWPTAKCKVKCGWNETCPIHRLKKRQKEMNFSEHPLWVRCYFL